MKAIHYILCAALCSVTACTDWDDHYNEGSSTEGGNLTLWEQMQQREELSDFCEVLENTKLFRMHKKTKASYAEILNSGQSFTVMAPVNGTFDKQAYIDMTATDQGDSIVEKFFVLNHIARSANSITDAKKRILMMNNKWTVVSKDGINSVKIAEGDNNVNVHAKNGILNVVSEKLPYYYNLYEQMTDREEYKAVGDFIRSYDRDEFDEASSVKNGTVDGVPVYIDSVIIERNDFLNNVLRAKLTSEDSTYWMVVPKAEGWQKAYDEAKTYFNYSPKEERRDSLQRLWSTYSLLFDGIYSMTTQSSPNDSLRSLVYSALEPEYSVFYKPFEEGGILSAAKATTSSNGVLYETEEWPFTPIQTFFRKMEIEAEYTSYIVGAEKCTYTSRQLDADSISNGYYLDIVPSSNTANWSITFRLPNTLSARYDICAILLPRSITDANADQYLPYQFKAELSYLDANGNKKTYAGDKSKFNTNDPLRVDTVVLAKDFEFPVCNRFDTANDNVTLKLTCSMSATENKRYTRPIYIDCIYLRPKMKE